MARGKYLYICLYICRVLYNSYSATSLHQQRFFLTINMIDWQNTYHVSRDFLWYSSLEFKAIN